MIKIGKVILVIVPFTIGVLAGICWTATQEGFDWGKTDFYTAGENR